MSEIESLLQPIEDERPTGRDLRLDPGDLTFQTLKDYTTLVDPAVSEGDAAEANWSGVEGLCMSALREKSKDLELITALAGAWIHTEGVEGLGAGIDLLHECVSRFWDTLHPGYDDEDGEITLPLRARWLNWMDTPKGFIQALKECAVVEAQGGVRLTWRDYENSALLEDVTITPERRQELIDAGVIGAGEWGAALGSVSPARIREMVEVFEKTIETLRTLGSFCSERFEDEEAPDFYNLINAIDEMREYFAGQLGDETAVASTPEAAMAVAPGVPAAAGGPIQSRQEALHQLQLVGDWFRRSEPHSPISYLVARAVKWGSMPLDQLFKDVVRNDDVIDHIWETLGLDASASDASSGEGEDDY